MYRKKFKFDPKCNRIPGGGAFKQEWHHGQSKTTVGMWEEMITGGEVDRKARDPMFGERRQGCGFRLSLEVDPGGFASEQ